MGRCVVPTPDPRPHRDTTTDRGLLRDHHTRLNVFRPNQETALLFTSGLHIVTTSSNTLFVCPVRNCLHKYSLISNNISVLRHFRVASTARLWSFWITAILFPINRSKTSMTSHHCRETLAWPTSSPLFSRRRYSISACSFSRVSLCCCCRNWTFLCMAARRCSPALRQVVPTPSTGGTTGCWLAGKQRGVRDFPRGPTRGQCGRCVTGGRLELDMVCSARCVC